MLVFWREEKKENVKQGETQNLPINRRGKKHDVGNSPDYVASVQEDVVQTETVTEGRLGRVGLNGSASIYKIKLIQ